MDDKLILRGFEENKEILKGRRIFLVCRGSFDRLDLAPYINELDPVRFSGFTPNPKMEEVMDGVEVFKASGCDTILAVGGGSPIDVAKCIKKYSESDAPIIAIPTTSGTGSESTHFAVVYENGNKLSVAAPDLLPDIVILEPATLKNVPEYTRKATMLDALCHAIESHWAKKATPESKGYAEKAIEDSLNPYKIAKQKGISVEEAQAIVAKEKDKLEKKKAKAEADRVKREEMKAEERRKMEEELEFFGTDDSELKKELREEGIYLVKAPKSIKEAGGRIPRSVRQHNEAKRKKAAEKLKRAQRNKKKK